LKNYLTLLNKGTKIGGAAVGSAVGSLAGPVGTVAGAAIGAVVGEVCVVVLDDLAKRLLSPREEQRVAGVAALAIDGIRERLLLEPKRDDGFFDSDADTPSPAEELFEGVLLSAKQEHEQLKLPYLANFYTNLIFDSSVKRAEANYLLSLAESLTYRQLCLLGLKSRLQKGKFEFRRAGWSYGASVSPETFDLTQQALYLYQRQLFHSKPKEIRAEPSFEVNVARPASATLSSIGQRLANLMALQNIDKDELEAVAASW
jgi:hypothetical protein